MVYMHRHNYCLTDIPTCDLTFDCICSGWCVNLCVHVRTLYVSCVCLHAYECVMYMVVHVQCVCMCVCVGGRLCFNIRRYDNSDVRCFLCTCRH